MAQDETTSIHAEYVDYTHGDTNLRGYLAYDRSLEARRPGVVVVHEWTGEGPYVEMRARQLAELGYVAFAADIYGVGVRPSNADAAAVATKYYQDRQLMRGRVNAALGALRSNPRVDTARLAAIGYCFGGACALELARSGADIKGVVAFHAGLSSPTPEDAKNISAKILVLEGGDDPYVPQEQIAEFVNEMRGGGVDWQLVQYGGAVHSFTFQGAGNDNSKGAAYNAAADRRSWIAMEDFFDEIFEV